MRKRGNMIEERKQRLASEVLSDVSDATIALSSLPRVIQSTIESLDLNERQLTSEQKRNIAENYRTIYDLLTLIQQTIYDTESKLESIPVFNQEKEGSHEEA